MVSFFKVSNFVEEEPVEIVHVDDDIQEVNEDGYFYEDIPSSQGPWSLNQDEYSSVKPLKVEPETFYVSPGEQTGKSHCLIHNNHYFRLQ